MNVRKNQENALLAEATEKFIADSAQFMREEFDAGWLKTKGPNLEDFLRQGLKEAYAIGFTTKLALLKYLITCVAMDADNESHRTAHHDFKITVKSLPTRVKKENMLNLYQQIYQEDIARKLNKEA